MVIERCTDDHNYSAIIRTVEALGVQDVWLIDSVKPLSDVQEELGSNVKQAGRRSNNKRGQKYLRSNGTLNAVAYLNKDDVETRKGHHLFAKRATEWCSIREFDNVEDCVRALREDGRAIWATDLGQLAVPLTVEALVGHQKQSRSPVSSSLWQSTSPSIVPRRLAIVFGTEAVVQIGYP